VNIRIISFIFDLQMSMTIHVLAHRLKGICSHKLVGMAQMNTLLKCLIKNCCINSVKSLIRFEDLKHTTTDFHI
jgi:hypothetical protein